MKIRCYASYAAWVLFLLGLLLTGCGGGEEAGVQPMLAPGEEKVSSRVALSWTQAGEGQLKVLNSNTFRTGSGDYVYLVGEIENTSSEDIGNVNVAVTVYNDQGKVVDKRSTEGLVRIVRAGDKTPYSTAMDARDAARYELQITGQPAQAGPKNKMELVSSSMTEPKAGYVWISGEVRNVGKVAAKAVQIIAVLYDDKGEVVEAVREELKGDLAPGETAPFKFIANHRGAKSSRLVVQAEDGE